MLIDVSVMRLRFTNDIFSDRYDPNPHRLYFYTWEFRSAVYFKFVKTEKWNSLFGQILARMKVSLKEVGRG